MEPLKPTAENIQRWAVCLKSIRQFFDSRGYFEVSTPNLVPVGAFESTIDPLKVSFKAGNAELHTSPEIEMKSVLAEAHLPIYQICKCYRDDPDTPIHAREFTMLEFYEPETDYRKMIGLMKELIIHVYGGNLSFKEYSVQEIFQKQGLSYTDGDSFFLQLIDKVEPTFDPNIPTILRDYPKMVSPLSKARGEVAERFEIYWKEMELCNGCSELDDPTELKRRYEEENSKRAQAGKARHPFPEKLLASANQMKQMAGVAVGLDRLFRCLP